MKEMKKILVVDDDLRMVKTICDILASKGYAALSAFSGEEAVDVVKTETPDCVLMDIKMPGMGGVEALKLIMEHAPALPVVLMSAYASEEQAEEARLRGACSILTKPIDIPQLLTFLSLLRKDESILIVDDDPQFCSLLMENFRLRNYRVEAEEDPEKALTLMEQKETLVVVLDLKLGSADGVDVMQDIHMRHPSKPVVLVTGCRDEMASAVEKGLRIGAYTCLYKPFRVEELINIVEEINRRKLRKVLVEPTGGE